MNFYIVSTFLAISYLLQLVSCSPFGFPSFNNGVDMFKNFAHLTANQIWVDVYNDIKASNNYSESCRESAISFHREVSVGSPDASFRYETRTYYLFTKQGCNETKNGQLFKLEDIFVIKNPSNLQPGDLYYSFYFCFPRNCNLEEMTSSVSRAFKKRGKPISELKFSLLEEVKQAKEKNLTKETNKDLNSTTTLASKIEQNVTSATQVYGSLNESLDLLLRLLPKKERETLERETAKFLKSLKAELNDVTKATTATTLALSSLTTTANTSTTSVNSSTTVASQNTTQ